MTVTEIATDRGFWNFGRLSIRYRLFGEPTLGPLPRPPQMESGKELSN
jgi:hypothetical protein